MAYKPCRECGERVPPYVRECPHCGEANPATTKQERLGRIFSKVVITICFIGVAGMALYLSWRDSRTFEEMGGRINTPSESTPDAEPTPTLSPTEIPAYEIVRTEDSSYGRVIRQALRIRVPKHYNKYEIEIIAHNVTDRFKNLRNLNAIMIYIYGPDSPIPGFPDVARVEWAPYGDWARASEVRSGNYANFEYSVHYTPPVDQSVSTQEIRRPPESTEAQRTQTPLELQIRDYSISFTAEHVRGRSFKVGGTTNLPDESYLSILIYDEDYFEHDNDSDTWRINNLTMIARSAVVKNGAFSLSTTATAIEAPLRLEKYYVEVSFNPRSYHNPTSVNEIVGENGEYLGGEQINNEIEGLTMLEIKQLISLKR